MENWNIKDFPGECKIGFTLNSIPHLALFTKLLSVNNNNNQSIHEQLYQYINEHVQYLQHSNRKCYKCKARGHIASECSRVCPKCKVPHSKKICIGDLSELIVELNYLSLEKVKDFQKSLKKDSLVETAAKLQKFEEDLNNIQEAKEQRKEIKRLEREIRSQYKKGNKNYQIKLGEVSVSQNADGQGTTSEYKQTVTRLTQQEITKVANVMYQANKQMSALIPKQPEEKIHKKADEEINVFVKQLVGLGNLKAISEYYIETDKYFKNKMREIKEHADSFTQARKQQLHQEHEEFKKAKSLGVAAVIKYKTNKLLAREQARKIQQEMKASLQTQQQNQAKIYKQMSYTMNHYKPKTEQEKLSVGTQNYLHTKRILSMLDFAEMRLKQIREHLKNKRYIIAEELYDKTDFSEVNKIVNPNPDCYLENLFNHGKDHTSYYIITITSYLSELQKKKQWYNSRMKTSTSQIYDAHV